MPDITVHPHGERWAVLEAGAESPTAEFETRQAAELAARGMADGGKVEVREEDPSGLRQDSSGAERSARSEPKIPAGEAQERTRATQTGL